MNPQPMPPNPGKNEYTQVYMYTYRAPVTQSLFIFQKKYLKKMTVSFFFLVVVKNLRFFPHPLL